jgi:acetyltransferase-like isoleucine patch superfamily enzyme
LKKLLGSFKRQLVRYWQTFWLGFGGHSYPGRIASRLGSLGARGYRGRYVLAHLTPKGYIHPEAEVIDVDLRLGKNVFIGERAVIARWKGDGYVELRDRVTINRDCTLEVIEGGSIIIGPQVGIENGCVLFSALQPIIIRSRAEIAPYCTFYSYDHGIASDKPIYEQPLTSKGPIVVEEDAWLGVGVTVLSGVRIGRGAVVGAGSVVAHDIPDGAVAVGTPARVVKYREPAEAEALVKN